MTAAVVLAFLSIKFSTLVKDALKKNKEIHQVGALWLRRLSLW
jgi:hypothetical protein